jgi:hypothetical protein
MDRSPENVAQTINEVTGEGWPHAVDISDRDDKYVLNIGGALQTPETADMLGKMMIQIRGVEYEPDMGQETLATEIVELFI